MEKDINVCSTDGCPNWAVRPGGKCHDCLSDHAAVFKCVRCGTKVIEFRVPHCPTCKCVSEFEDIELDEAQG